jgi:chaperonin cofactor prefoldin
MRKKLYIHIGTAKTGTSALQKFFSSNRSVLKKNGVLYPINRGIGATQPAHHRLCWCFRPNQSDSLFSEVENLKNWPVDLATPEQEWGFVKEQFTETVNLISSEAFFGLNLHDVPKVYQLTREFDVKVVIYWRRKDFLADSFCSQNVKSRKSIEKRSSKRINSLPSKNRLDVWRDVFGQDNVILRPYEKCQLYRKDIISDFLYHVLNLEITSEFKVPKKQVNISLHHIALEYKRLVNNFSMSASEIQAIKRALQEITEYMINEGRKNYSIFSPQDRLEFVLNSAAEDRAIASEYLGRDDGKLFYDPLPNPDEEWQPYEVLREDDAQLIDTFLAQNHPSVFINIVREILSAHYSQKGEVLKAAEQLIPKNSVDDVFKALSEGVKKLEKRNKNAQGRIDALENQIQALQEDMDRQKKELNEIYNSRTWKTGMSLNRLYNKMPGWLQKSALSLGKWIYNRTKK